MTADEDRPVEPATARLDGDGEWAAARAAVLAEVDRVGDRGGPSLRPAAVHAAHPLTGFGFGVPGSGPAELPGGGTDLAGLVGGGTDLAGRYGPGADVGGFRIAGAVPGSAGAAGIAGAAAASRDLATARRWQSERDWVGPLSGSVERRLLLVACDVVAGIANAPAWAQFDGPRPDLAAELDAIDEHAHHLAELRAETGGAHEAVPPAWQALVDRVTALVHYAHRLTGTHPEPGADAAVREQHVERTAADAAHDEMAVDHLRLLTDNLPTHPE